MWYLADDCYALLLLLLLPGSIGVVHALVAGAGRDVHDLLCGGAAIEAIQFDFDHLMDCGLAALAVTDRSGHCDHEAGWAAARARGQGDLLLRHTLVHSHLLGLLGGHQASSLRFAYWATFSFRVHKFAFTIQVTLLNDVFTMGSILQASAWHTVGCIPPVSHLVRLTVIHTFFLFLSCG